MFGSLNVRREGLEVVFRSSGMLQAQIIKGRLEASGIPVALDYEALGQVYGFTIDGLGEVRVLVPSDRVADALELIETTGDEAIEEIGEIADEDDVDDEEDEEE